MADRGKEPVAETNRTLEMLWANQDNVNRRIDAIAADLQKLSVDFRREFNLLRARPIHQDHHRDEGRANRTYPRRRIEGDRQERLLQVNPQDASDSEEDLNPVRGGNQIYSSGEEVDNRYGMNHHRERVYPQYRRHPGEFKVKMDIPFFDGHLHIEDLLDWEKAVENFFDYLDIDPDKQVKYVACQLKGGASAWWEQTIQSRWRDGRNQIRSWSRMKQLLRSQFLPTDYEQILYMRYQHCTQGTRSVSEYTEEFNRLSARNDLNETANQLVARYIGGLKDNIQDQLELNAVWSIPQAVNLAMKIEMQHSRKSWFPYSRRHWQEPSNAVTKSTPHPPIRSSPPTPSNTAAGPSTVPVDGRNTPKPKTTNSANPYAKPSTLKCFRCFQPGHKSNECPQRQQVHIAEPEDDINRDESDGDKERTYEEFSSMRANHSLGLWRNFYWLRVSRMLRNAMSFSRRDAQSAGKYAISWWIAGAHKI
ncbi:hypothetical protein KFK09_021594 [Dendrobium nobile]|uniref:CCHC-type domain-containing protein n=1 Tax=Dendrobium nobile TaxID=94219 RepID=A0A8T3APN1_DENNO|nr:hypothetical protein KFK09_021594 [Dendrobium nobile]